MIARYRRVLDGDPSAAFALQRLIELVRERDGGVDVLVTSLEQEVAAQAAAYAPRMVLASLYRAQSRSADAQRVYREAAQLRPDAAAPLAALAALVRADGGAAEARSLFDAALGRARDDATKQELVRQAAELAMDAGDWEAARAYYDRLVPPRGASVYLATEFARALSARSEHVRAAAELERLRQRLRGDARVLGPLLRDLGRAYRDAGDATRAIAALEEGLRATRESGLRRELYELLTDTHRRAGRLAELATRLRSDRNSDAMAARAAIEDELGHEDEALAAYRRVLAGNPRDLDTRLRVVQLLARSGRLAEVIEEYRALLRAVPGEPRFVVELAQLLVQTGRRDEALRLAADTSRRFAREPRVHRALAELYARWNESALAAQEVAVLARIEPNDPTHLVALGAQQLEAGDPDAARATWRRILTVETDQARAQATLGGIYADHDFLAEAVTAYREAVRLAPDDVEALRGLAGVLERTGESAQAAEAWQRVLATATDRAERREARQRIVALWARARELPRRLAELERSFRAEPPDLEAGRFLAEAYARSSPPRGADAERVLDRVVSAAPGDVESLLALERARTARGDLAGAISVLERLVQADDRRAATYLQRMAEHALALYRDEDAIGYARRAVERSPADAAGQRRLGDLYRARQDMPDAIAAYRRAIELDDRLFATYFDLAEIHLASGQLREADALFRRVVRTSPDDELVARAARASIQIHLGAGTLEELEQELLPLVLASPQRPILRRLVVELYEALVGPLALASRAPEASGDEARARLSRIGARALKPLLEALADADPAQRTIAVELLAELGNANAAGPLLALAEADGDTLLRARALVAAGALGRPSAQQSARLLALAAGPEARLRDSAAWALARSATRADVASLRVLAGHGDPSVRAFAALGLGIARDGGARPALELLLTRDPSVDVQAAAAWALGRLADPGSVGVLAASLRGRGLVVAQASALALGHIGDARAQQALAQAFFGADVTLRAAAASGLALDLRVGRASPLPAPSVPVSARGYLARLVEQEAVQRDGPVDLAAQVDALADGARDALAGPIERVRSALDVLASGAGPRVGLGPLTAGIDAWPAPRRAAAEGALTALGRALLPSLLEAAQHPDASVRAAAVRTLARVDGSAARVAVAAALDDQAAVVRRSALDVVSAADGEEALGRVVRLARSGDDWALRARAATALGRFLGADGAAAGAALVDALRDDPYAFVREAAAAALGAASDPEVRAALMAAAASDPEPRVRDAAGRALGVGPAP
jgi:tetratricopeptide (TPR) repeat protein